MSNNNNYTMQLLLLVPSTDRIAGLMRSPIVYIVNRDTNQVFPMSDRAEMRKCFQRMFLHPGLSCTFLKTALSPTTHIWVMEYHTVHVMYVVLIALADSTWLYKLHGV